MKYDKRPLKESTVPTPSPTTPKPSKMPNLRRLLVIPTLGGGNSSGPPPAQIEELAAALDGALPHSILDLTDPYFNSAAMHQALKQKFEAVGTVPPLISQLRVDPPALFGHEPDPDLPGQWIDTLSEGGGGVIYAIEGEAWSVGIRFS